VARVLLTDEAKEDLGDLDGAMRKRVAAKLLELEDHPEQRGGPLGSRRTGNLTGFRKLTVGDREIRIVYRLEANGDVVVTWVIAGRADSECYDLALARLETYETDSETRRRLIDAISSTLIEIRDATPH
jgi:mRNA interferase RelE/StbE